MSDKLLTSIIERLHDVDERLHDVDDGLYDFFEYIPGNDYINKLDVNSVLPLKSEDYKFVYITNSRNIDDYIIDNHLLILVNADGGGEGEGEYVERVFGAYPIIDAGYENFYVNIKDARFFKFNGCYQSYDGVTWDLPSDLVEVTPKIVQVIQYV